MRKLNFLNGIHFNSLAKKVNNPILNFFNAWGSEYLLIVYQESKIFQNNNWKLKIITVELNKLVLFGTSGIFSFFNDSNLSDNFIFMNHKSKYLSDKFFIFYQTKENLSSTNYSIHGSQINMPGFTNIVVQQISTVSNSDCVNPNFFFLRNTNIFVVWEVKNNITGKILINAKVVENGNLNAIIQDTLVSFFTQTENNNNPTAFQLEDSKIIILWSCQSSDNKFFIRGSLLNLNVNGSVDNVNLLFSNLNTVTGYENLIFPQAFYINDTSNPKTTIILWHSRSLTAFSTKIEYAVFLNDDLNIAPGKGEIIINYDIPSINTDTTLYDDLIFYPKFTLLNDSEIIVYWTRYNEANYTYNNYAKIINFKDHTKKTTFRINNNDNDKTYIYRSMADVYVSKTGRAIFTWAQAENYLESAIMTESFFNCPLKFYADTSNGNICRPCHESCNICDGFYNCTTCYNRFDSHSPYYPVARMGYCASSMLPPSN
jgi:hypothetical protein